MPPVNSEVLVHLQNIESPEQLNARIINKTVNTRQAIECKGQNVWYENGHISNPKIDRKLNKN